MTIAEFKAYFPEFNSTDDTQIQRALDIALATTSESVLGSNFELGLKYLTAHFVTINSKQFAGNGSNTRSISSKSVDGVSLSYGDSLNNDTLNGMLNTTSYGQMYNRLTLGYGAGGFTC
jgi:hypothetical protein